LLSPSAQAILTPMLVRTACFALFVSVLAACGGSQERVDNTGWETREGLQGLGIEESDEIAAAPVGLVPPRLEAGWAGVRHDLALAPSKKNPASCSCLSVVVGEPNDPRFVWRGVRPSLASSHQALAISASGLDCPGAPPPADRRPSISAIDTNGSDVVVEIEEVPSDRPLASGAILQNLGATARVFVRQRNPKLPYAKPSGLDLCRVR
jgi:hypothetical protein